jgi:hypothetical protein
MGARLRLVLPAQSRVPPCRTRSRLNREAALAGPAVAAGGPLGLRAGGIGKYPPAQHKPPGNPPKSFRWF